jgi:hypothetical protein
MDKTCSGARRRSTGKDPSRGANWASLLIQLSGMRTVWAAHRSGSVSGATGLGRSFDHLVRASEKRGGDRETKCLSRTRVQD